MSTDPEKIHAPRALYILPATGMAILLTACAGSGVRVDQQSGADLARCGSFAWTQSATEPTSLTDQRIRDAALDSLRAKGYTVVESGADCGVSYAIDIGNRSRSRSSIGFGLGGGGGNFGGGVGVSLPLGGNKLRAAILRLNVSDSTRNTQIWTASLDTEVSDPLTAEQATTTVSKLLANFPDRTLAK